MMISWSLKKQTMLAQTTNEEYQQIESDSDNKLSDKSKSGDEVLDESENEVIGDENAKNETSEGAKSEKSIIRKLLLGLCAEIIAANEIA